MFKGFWGCMLAGGAIAAGAITGQLVVMLAGAGAGVLLAALSAGAAELDVRAHKQAAYPNYKY